MTKGKKLFSFLMALCMVMSMSGIAALAADDVLKPEAGQNAEVVAPSRRLLRSILVAQRDLPILLAAQWA